MSYVYIVDINGRPLMPTDRFGKVRRLLKEGKAKVYKRTPFTIQLLYNQPKSLVERPKITLGIDVGSETIGFSVTTDKRELICGEMKLRTDVRDNLYTRKFLRSARRNRKTRYRPARFLNRIKSKKEGWLAPSIKQKVNSHIRLVEELFKILPIDEVVIEIANFDTQKLENPEIKGKEYQEGDQLGFWNTREFVLHRDNHTCQACKGKSKDKILEVHHKIRRKDGGSDSPKNLITLCKTCHKNYHQGNLKYKFDTSQRSKSLKDATHMNIMKKSIYKDLAEVYPNVKVTFGYITKSKRIEKGISKEHYNDAYIIAGNLEADQLDTYYKFKCLRNHNRQLHKMLPSKGGIRKPNLLPKYMYGYQIYDKVYVKNKGIIGYISSRRKTGSFSISDIEGKLLVGGVSYKKLRLLESRCSIMISMLSKV